jgi:hypothetical protein
LSGRKTGLLENDVDRIGRNPKKKEDIKSSLLLKFS